MIGEGEFIDVSVSEKTIEDWAEEYLAPYIHPNARLLGRQVTLPSGKRLDLLFLHDVCGRQYWTVVELKAEEVDLNTVVQCLGYVNELRSAGYTNVVVRGVVAAPSFAPGVRQVVSEMQAMAVMTLFPRLSVRATPLYQRCERTHEWGSAPPPDVDATRPKPTPLGYSGYDSWREIRTLIDRLYLEDDARVEGRRGAVDESVALVPLRFTPLAVTYSNNGRH